MEKGSKLLFGAMAVLAVLTVFMWATADPEGSPSAESQADKPTEKPSPEEEQQRGMEKLWEGYEEPKEKLSKRHPEPEAKKVIRLTGDAKRVTLSGFQSCGKTFYETVRPPFEAKVPYCDDRWESGWVQASTRAEGEVKLELLVDGQVQQTVSLSNKRRLESEEYTEDLILRSPPKAKDRKGDE